MLHNYHSNTLRTILNWFHFPHRQTKRTPISVPDAIEAAYQQFSQAYPEWTASLFDDIFLQKEMTVLFNQNRLPTSLQLAVAWHKQLGGGRDTQQSANVQQILPIVSEFLQMVQKELNGNQPMYENLEDRDAGISSRRRL